MRNYALFLIIAMIIGACNSPYSKSGQGYVDRNDNIKAIDIPANNLIESRYHLINDTIHVCSELSYFTLSYNYNDVIVYVDVVIEGDMIKFSSIRIE